LGRKDNEMAFRYVSRRAAAAAATAASAAVAASLVVACGGETIAVLGAIGAAGGDWLVDDNPATAALEPRANPNDPINPQAVNLQPLRPASDPFGFLYASEQKMDIPAISIAGCGSVVPNTTQATVADNRLVIPNCFSGKFASVNRVVSDDGQKALVIESFDPTLAQGIWVDIDNRSRRVKFVDDTSGCEIKDGKLTGNTVTVVQGLPDSSTGTPARITQFTIGTQTWTAGEYVGVSGLRLTGGPGKLELKRERDTDPPAVSCP
jgi:hypothetical protein